MERQGGPRVAFVVVTKGLDYPTAEERRPSGARYTRDAIRGMLQFMGCKPRHAYKAAQLVFQKLEAFAADGRKYSSGSRQLWGVGAHDEGSVYVTMPRSEFYELVCSTLTEYNYKYVPSSDEIKAACSLKERRRHIIVLLCGTSGSGKSTLASILASRLGISTVLSTDSVRHMMRGFTFPEETPLLFASTYEAGEALRKQQALDGARAASVHHHHQVAAAAESPAAAAAPDGGGGTSGAAASAASGGPGAHDLAIRGYKAQCELVSEQLEQLICGFEARRQSLVVEGVHLHVGLVVRLLQRHPGVVPFLVYIKNEGKHVERMAVRAKYMTLDPNKNKYVKNMRNIRWIQDYLFRKAEKHAIPCVENTNIDRSVGLIHLTLLGCLKRMMKGEQVLDAGSSTVRMLYNEYTAVVESLAGMGAAVAATPAAQPPPAAAAAAPGAEVTAAGAGTTAGNAAAAPPPGGSNGPFSCRGPGPFQQESSAVLLGAPPPRVLGSPRLFSRELAVAAAVAAVGPVPGAPGGGGGGDAALVGGPRGTNGSSHPFSSPQLDLPPTFDGCAEAAALLLSSSPHQPHTQQLQSVLWMQACTARRSGGSGPPDPTSPSPPRSGPLRPMAPSLADQPNSPQPRPGGGGGDGAVSAGIQRAAPLTVRDGSISGVPLLVGGTAAVAAACCPSPPSKRSAATPLSSPPPPPCKLVVEDGGGGAASSAATAAVALTSTSAEHQVHHSSCIIALEPVRVGSFGGGGGDSRIGGTGDDGGATNGGPGRDPDCGGRDVSGGGAASASLGQCSADGQYDAWHLDGAGLAAVVVAGPRPPGDPLAPVPPLRALAGGDYGHGHGNCHGNCHGHGHGTGAEEVPLRGEERRGDDANAGIGGGGAPTAAQAAALASPAAAFDSYPDVQLEHQGQPQPQHEHGDVQLQQQRHQQRRQQQHSGGQRVCELKRLDHHHKHQDGLYHTHQRQQQQQCIQPAAHPHSTFEGQEGHNPECAAPPRLPPAAADTAALSAPIASAALPPPAAPYNPAVLRAALSALSTAAGSDAICTRDSSCNGGLYGAYHSMGAEAPVPAASAGPETSGGPAAAPASVPAVSLPPFPHPSAAASSSSAALSAASGSTAGRSPPPPGDVPSSGAALSPEQEQHVAAVLPVCMQRLGAGGAKPVRPGGGSCGGACVLLPADTRGLADRWPLGSPSPVPYLPYLGAIEEGREGGDASDGSVGRGGKGPSAAAGAAADASASRAASAAVAAAKDAYSRFGDRCPEEVLRAVMESAILDEQMDGVTEQQQPLMAGAGGGTEGGNRGGGCLALARVAAEGSGEAKAAAGPGAGPAAAAVGAGGEPQRGGAGDGAMPTASAFAGAGAWSAAAAAALNATAFLRSSMRLGEESSSPSRSGYSSSDGAGAASDDAGMVDDGDGEGGGGGCARSGDGAAPGGGDAAGGRRRRPVLRPGPGLGAAAPGDSDDLDGDGYGLYGVYGGASPLQEYGSVYESATHDDMDEHGDDEEGLPLGRSNTLIRHLAGALERSRMRASASAAAAAAATIWPADGCAAGRPAAHPGPAAAAASTHHHHHHQQQQRCHGPPPAASAGAAQRLSISRRKPSVSPASAPSLASALVTVAPRGGAAAAAWAPLRQHQPQLQLQQVLLQQQQKQEQPGSQLTGTVGS